MNRKIVEERSQADAFGWGSFLAALVVGPSEWPRWAWGVVVGFLLVACWFMLFAVAMYLQELKSYGGRVSFVKMAAFSLTWMIGSIWVSLACVPELLMGRYESAAARAHYYGSVMGQYMFVILTQPPIVEGLENLPPDGEKGMVFVSNHQTSVDIALFYYIGAARKFSWVSKSTVFLIPGVGLLMKIAKYVALTRGNKNSVIKMFDDCKNRLASGWSVMIFPQGTRRRLKILDFKDGAFQLAIDSNSVVVSGGAHLTVTGVCCCCSRIVNACARTILSYCYYCTTTYCVSCRPVVSTRVEDVPRNAVSPRRTDTFATRWHRFSCYRRSC